MSAPAASRQAWFAESPIASLRQLANGWLPLFFVVALLAPPIAIGDSAFHPAITIAAIGLLIGFARLDDWRFERSALSAAIVAFFVILAISLAPATLYSGTDIATASLARVALAAISAYVFFYASCGPGRRSSIPMALLVSIASASAAFAILDFYFQFPAPAGFGPQFVWLETGVFRRAQGVFYEASTLGNFCVFFLVMIAIVFVRRIAVRFPARAALVAGGAVLMTALILSYSRSCVIALAIALAALSVIEWRRLAVRRIALVGAITAAAVVAILVQFFPDYANLYWTRLTASLDLALESNARVLSGRVESWQTLLAFLAEHPWHALIGVGYKTLSYSNFTGEPIVADNMYLSMLVETGVLGLAALVALNVAIIRAGFRAARSADPSRSFYGTWIFCFWIAESVQMLSADLLTFWRVIPVYFWVLAIAVRKDASR